MGDTGIEPVTSSVSGKRATAAPIAQVVTPGGGDGIRTRVDGFAGRCLSSRPLHHSRQATARLTLPTRADDEIRTRDPNLGKVVRYHCATSAFDTHFCVLRDSSLAVRLKTILTRSVTKPVAQRVARLTSRQFRRGRLAQLVARFLHTEEVISSSLVSPTPSVNRSRRAECATAPACPLPRPARRGRVQREIPRARRGTRFRPGPVV